VRPFAELSSGFALARRVLAGTRPPRTKEMDGLKLTDMQWESIVAAWDQEPSRRPVLSSGGEPMIYCWRPGTEATHAASHRLDLNVQEAMDALNCLLSITPRTRPSDNFHRGVTKVFSFIVRLGRIPIRRHEDALLRSIYDHVLFRHMHDTANYDSPYFKIFLLLWAHFSRLPLSPELAADLAIVLERIFSLFSVCAHHDWSNSGEDVFWPFVLFPLIHMCVHGMWKTDPGLKQIQHFDNDVSCSIKRQGLRLIHASGYLSFLCSRHQVRA
jgi:hypothetical protein